MINKFAKKPRIKILTEIEPKIIFSLVRVCVLVLLCVIMSMISPVFLGFKNISNVITNACIMIILGVGETPSPRRLPGSRTRCSILTITSVVAAIMLKAGIHFGFAIPTALVFGLLLGLLNGLLIAKVKLPPFIATYGLQWAIFGFAYVILKGYVLYDFDEKFRFIGNGFIFKVIPMPIVVMVIVVLVGLFIMRKTTIGRKFYSIGANKEAARLSGINVEKITILAYVISGILAALAGIVLVARINAVQADIGKPYLLPTIAAVYMGGTSATGGQGGLLGTIIGALIMTVVENGMNLIGVPSTWRDAISGAMIILTVLLNISARKRLNKIVSS